MMRIATLALLVATATATYHVDTARHLEEVAADEDYVCSCPCSDDDFESNLMWIAKDLCEETGVCEEGAEEGADDSGTTYVSICVGTDDEFDLLDEYDGKVFCDEECLEDDGEDEDVEDDGDEGDDEDGEGEDEDDVNV